jgi:hypothetical protein
MSRLLTSALTLFFAIPLAAQDEPAAQGKAGGGDGKGVIRAVDEELVEKGGKEGFNPETGEKGGFNLDKQPRVMTARGHARFDGAIQPRRLMPGQSGKLLVTMMLEGDSVMPSPSTLTMAAAQGGMALGSWTLLPAQVGRIAPAYMGQPVYDNWAVIEATVTMPPEARIGEKRNAVLELEFDLHSGATGQALGHFRESVTVPCEVGVAANPAVLGGVPAGVGAAAQPAAEPVKAVEDAKGEVTAPESAANSGSRSPEAAELADPTPAPAAPPVDTEVGSSAELAPSAEESTKDSLLFVGGGAAAVIVLVALLLMRRR